MMRSALASRAARLRSSSLTTVPPPAASQDYSSEHATIAASILYQCPLPAKSGLPLYILNAAAFPDAFEVDYDSLLPYVLARLPGEDDLLSGAEYEVVFFAGGQPESATSEKKQGPGIGWYLQAYHVLSRASRKRLQRLWVVHERSWVRVLIEVFGTIVSPKFKKKIVHVNTLSGLAMHLPLENLLIPPAVYLHDRRLVKDIYVPYVTSCRSFGADNPLPKDYNGRKRLPRVLRETTTFVCQRDNVKIEGIFRIPPQAMLRDILKEAYDRGQRFIVWKERNASFVEPGMDTSTLAEVQECDAYGVHLAAGLIKVWYRELKTPIFPEASYDAIRKAYSSPDAEINQQDLTNLLSPFSEHSVLPHTNRLIINWHLLPLLSFIASCERYNKMSPENLAICFSPALVCGSDQMQDAKMTSIIRRVLGEAIRLWPIGLRDACGMSVANFGSALQPPASHVDYEDPLHESYRPQYEPEMTESFNRITLRDDEQEAPRPPLPPRTSSLSREPKPSPPPPRRKPAPVVDTFARYSTLTETPRSQSPQSYTSAETPSSMPTDSVRSSPTKVKIGISPATPTKPEKSHSLPVTADVSMPLRASPEPAPGVRSRTGSILRKPVSSAAVPSLSEIKTQGSQLRSVSGDSAKSSPAEDDTFIKPTWAASSRKTSASSIDSQKEQSSPLLSIAKNANAHSNTINVPATRVDSGTGSQFSTYLPKPRAPSPGLLQRMKGWEQDGGDGVGGAASRLGVAPASPRKQSVDDLKRLYEERAGAAAGLKALSRQSTGN